MHRRPVALALVLVLIALSACTVRGEESPIPAAGAGAGGSAAGSSATGAGGSAGAIAPSAGRGGGASGAGGSSGSSAAGSAGAMDGGVAGTGGDAAAMPAMDAAADSGVEPPASYAVGTRRIEIAGPMNRTLPVQLWYPAVESARAQAQAGRPASEFEPEGPRRTQLATLMAAAPACTNKTMHAADAPAVFERAEPFPLILFSHCFVGTRFALFSVAERLASLGFVVAAADHTGETLYDYVAGSFELLTPEELERRAADVAALLDVLLDADAAAMPADLRGALDADRIGMFGHSFGSMTTGVVTSREPRIKASAFIAASASADGVSPVVVSQLHPPALFIVAIEDNSITEIGNAAIRDDYAAYPQPALKIELADAGHWSVSDLNGIVDVFMPGCGMATRQTRAFESFTYLDPEVAREITRRYVGAFFERHLLGRPGAELDEARPGAIVMRVEHD